MPTRHILVLPSWYPTPAFPYRGRFILDQARALRACTGWKVGVVAPQLVEWRRRPLSQLRALLGTGDVPGPDGLIVWARPVAAPPLRSARRAFLLAAARRLVRAYMARHGRPDLIHAHGALPAGSAAAVLARETGIPLVVTEHWSAVHEQSLAAVDRAEASEVYRCAAAVSAVSESLAAVVAGWSDRNDVQVLSNTVDTEFFTPSTDSRIPGRLLTVGNLVPVKGMDRVLRAFAAYPDAAATLVVGGDGPEAGALRTLAHELGIGRRVTWLGALSREQVRDEMRRAELFVLASRSETFGVVLLEAAATGLRYLSTESGGPSSFTVQELGRLTPAVSAGELAAAIRDVRAAPAPLSPAAMHALVASRYGPAVAGMRVKAFLETGLQSDRAPRLGGPR